MLNTDRLESGFGFEAGIQRLAFRDAYDGGTRTVRTRGLELWAGGRYELVYELPDMLVHPYVSGGLSRLASNYSGPSGEIDGDFGGFYLGVGVDLDISGNFFIGFGLRHVNVGEPGAIIDTDFTQSFVRIGSWF